MQFEHEVKITIKVGSSNLQEILLRFLESLGPIFGALVSAILLHYGSEYAQSGYLRELLGLSSGDTWHWKSKKGYKSMVIHTLFGKVYLLSYLVRFEMK